MTLTSLTLVGWEENRAANSVAIVSQEEVVNCSVSLGGRRKQPGVGVKGAEVEGAGSQRQAAPAPPGTVHGHPVLTPYCGGVERGEGVVQAQLLQPPLDLFPQPPAGAGHLLLLPLVLKQERPLACSLQEGCHSGSTGTTPVVCDLPQLPSPFGDLEVGGRRKKLVIGR